MSKPMPKQLQAIINKYKKEYLRFVFDGVDFVNYPEFYDALYEYFLPDMPYGIAKARTGDPYNYICQELDKYSD